MIDDIFIFDSVIHVYDLSAANTIPRPEAEAVYGAIDMAWAKLVGQIARAYAK